MKIKTSELIKALEFLKKHGDTQEIDVSVDANLETKVIIKADAMGDDVLIHIFDSDLNIFPKITRTERL